MEELFLMASVAGQDVAIRSDQVESVVDITAIIPAPRTSRAVCGLAALRSRVVTVIDTAIVLGDPAGVARRRRAVVTQVDGHHYALLVDSLDDVTEFVPQPLSAGVTLGPAWSGIASGMTERDRRPILILNLPAIVARVAGEAREAA
jgi:purine-binding chemotaxis protein CheW